MLKKSTLFSLVAASAWLSPAPSVAVAQETDAAKQVLAQLNAERETTRILLEQLQSTDPTVIDVYFKLDENDQRTMVVSRVTESGLIETWEAPADIINNTFNEAENKIKEDNPEASSGSDWTSAIAPMLGGMLAGYLLSNAFSGAGKSAQMTREAHERERRIQSSAYSANAASRTQQLRQTSPNNTLNRSATTPARPAVGQSQGGTFNSSGARSSGYSLGG